MRYIDFSRKFGMVKNKYTAGAQEVAAWNNIYLSLITKMTL